MMKSVPTIALLLLASFSHAQVIAVTLAGDTVHLLEDGTWQKQQKISENPQLKEHVWILARDNPGASEYAEQAYSMALQGWRYVPTL